MTYEETKIYYEEQRKLSVQLGIPILTAVQPKREVVMEMVNFKESYDFLDKMHFDGWLEITK